MKSSLGASFEGFLKSYFSPTVKGVRANTLKISADGFEMLAPVTLDGCVPWEKNGFYALGDSLGKNIWHAAGLYYVQEPSAMCAVPELEIEGGERVLDLCAAPGGKSTQIAQAMRGEGLLVSNEIDYKRSTILASNLERLGVKNSVVTCRTPEYLAERFPEYFDKILVDAPCSGEGMFKKEENAIPEWSLENVGRCAERQEKILESAAQMLAGGGRLVYSTCTFAPEEDEGQIDNFLKKHKNFKLISMKKLLPHEVRGEGHFCAALEKTDGERNEIRPVKYPAVQKNILNVFNEWAKDTLNIEIKNVFVKGERSIVWLYSLPDGMPEMGRIPQSAGVLLATVNPLNGTIQPAHSLAMSLKKDEAKHIEVDEKTALNFLRGLTFECPESEKGWRVVTVKGFPIGWCKAVNGVAKNHLPKGLRI